RGLVVSFSGQCDGLYGDDSIGGDHRVALFGLQHFLTRQSCRLDGPATSFRFRPGAKAVANPWFGDDVLGLLRIWLDLLAEAGDQDAKVLDLVTVVRSPYCLQEFPMGHCLIRVLRQISKKVEFLRREMEARVTVRHRPRGKVDHKAASANPFLRRLWCSGHSPKRSTYAGQKLRSAERLHHKIVGA